MTVFAGFASFRTEHNGSRLDPIKEASSRANHEIATSVVERPRRSRTSARHRRRLDFLAADGAFRRSAAGDRAGRARCDDRGAEAAEAAAPADRHHRHQRRHRDHRLPDALRHPQARRRRRRRDAGNAPGPDHAVSGAQGRTAGDDRRVRCAASRWRRLCHRPRHEPRRRSRALQWIRSQSAKRAIIIGVCAGAKVVGDAGLLHGKRATTHWYSVKELRGKHPTMRYVEDRRLVVDDGVATTTGITASMPMSLTLIEAIAGRDKAQAVGRDIGLADWDARHESDAFKFTRPFALTAIGNTAAFWSHEQLGIELKPGVDEVSLALVTDAWSRTYRSQAVTFARARRRPAKPQRHSHLARSRSRRAGRRSGCCRQIGESQTSGSARRRAGVPLRPATERARPTSSRCSWSIRGTGDAVKIRRVGKAKRAHHYSVIADRWWAPLTRLCPPYATSYDNHRHGSTMILVCASGLARSANALATPSMPTLAVTIEAASTCPSAIRRSEYANSSGV